MHGKAQTWIIRDSLLEDRTAYKELNAALCSSQHFCVCPSWQQDPWRCHPFGCLHCSAVIHLSILMRFHCPALSQSPLSNSSNVDSLCSALRIFLVGFLRYVKGLVLQKRQPALSSKLTAVASQISRAPPFLLCIFAGGRCFLTSLKSVVIWFKSFLGDYKPQHSPCSHRGMTSFPLLSNDQSTSPLLPPPPPVRVVTASSLASQ